MKRGDGKVFLRPGSSNYWIRYSVGGKQYRESAKTTEPEKARDYLKFRMKQAGAHDLGYHEFLGPKAERVTVGDLLTDLKNNLSMRGKWGSRLKSMFDILRPQFGRIRAMSLDRSTVDAWITSQVADGYKPATINRKVQILSQAFRLGRDRVGGGPEFTKLEEINIREGFFDLAEILAVMTFIKDIHLRDLIEFAFLTGWRRGEISALKWSNVDMRNKTLLLPARFSKNRKSRKMILDGQLLEVIRRRWERRRAKRSDGLVFVPEYVFHRRGGRKVDRFDKAWKTACDKAKVPDRLFHDLRRSAARNMRKAGVPETVAMKITGHLTSSMFKRYDIADDRDIAEAVIRTQQYLDDQPKERNVEQIEQVN